VILRANRHLTTLLDFQYRHLYEARRGEKGGGARRTGRSGENVVLDVPEGTVVRDAASGEILADLTVAGVTICVARGGRGGRGNSAFATSTNQAPRRAEPGEPGEEREIELELKLIADVGLVGLPNAGKSTLISVISAARPKIADYPFTTLIPNLGIVRREDGGGFVVADIPGLIEGAHAGKGLGLQFLRHIDRTRVLVFLLEAPRGSVKEDYAVLTHELRSYDRSLPRRPSILAISKIDAVDEPALRALRKLRFGTKPVHMISAVTGEGIRGLLKDIDTHLRRKSQAAKRRKATDENA
jgi:GTP-binding protein